MTSTDYKCLPLGCTKVAAGTGDFPGYLCGGQSDPAKSNYGAACPVNCCIGLDAKDPADQFTCRNVRQVDCPSGAAVQDCATCFPDGQFWCADGSSQPVKITSKSQWDALDKNKGKLSSTGDCPKSSLWMWIWLALIVATVAAIIVLSIIYMKGKKKVPSKYRYR